jgi:hypothetical protein
VYDADARHMLASGSEPRIPETTERTSCTSRSRKTKQSMWSIPPVGRSRLVRRLGERRASSRLHRTLEPELGLIDSTPHRNDLTSAPADPILSRARWGLSAAQCEPGLCPNSSHMVRAQVVPDEIFGLVEDRRSVMANRDSGMMDDRLLIRSQPCVVGGHGQRRVTGTLQARVIVRSTASSPTRSETRGISVVVGPV